MPTLAPVYLEDSSGQAYQAGVSDLGAWEFTPVFGPMGPLEILLIDTVTGLTVALTMLTTGAPFVDSASGTGALNIPVYAPGGQLFGIVISNGVIDTIENPGIPTPFAYPLTPPAIAGLGPQDITLAFENLVGENDSPFDLSDQVFLWPGDMLTLEANLPPMLLLQAEQWISFLAMLLGKLGTFLMGDYNRPIPQGAMSGTPKVNGANPSGSNQLQVRGAANSVPNWAVAGDYVQVKAAGGLQRIHKVLLNADSDAMGQVTLNIRPSIRETLADGVAIVTENCTGTFRLQSNALPWKEDRNRVYAISFKAREAGLP
jgi:hypothetical protein